MTYPDTLSPKPLNHPEFYALLGLARGAAHGYALKAIIRNDTLGAVTLDDGRIYRLIAKLYDEGFIDMIGQQPAGKSGHPRMYYALSASGLIRLKEECLRLNYAANIANYADLL